MPQLYSMARRPPPEGWNALWFDSEETSGLVFIFAHCAAYRPLPELVEGLFAGGKNTSTREDLRRKLDVELDADVTWSGYPAREIVYTFFGRQRYLVVRADDVRYTLACKGAAEVCRAVDEQFTRELLGGATFIPAEVEGEK